MFKKKPDVSALPIGPIPNSQATNNTPDFSVLPIGTILMGQMFKKKPDVSVLPIGPILKSRCPRRRLLKMKPTGSPETSVWTHLTPRNNPQDGRNLLHY
jgi:hypothetical protein